MKLAMETRSQTTIMFFLFSLSASFPPKSDIGRLIMPYKIMAEAMSVAFRPSFWLRISVNMGQIMDPMLVMILPIRRI